MLCGFRPFLINTNLLEPSLVQNPTQMTSSFRKSKVKVKDKFLEGFKFHIGDGTTLVWYDYWNIEGFLCNEVHYVHLHDFVTIAIKSLTF